MITKTTIFTYQKQDVKTIVETISSNYINNGVFSQISDDRVLYSIVFFSTNLNITEYDYKIYEKELFAIMRYFK